MVILNGSQFRIERYVKISKARLHNVLIRLLKHDANVKRLQNLEKVQNLLSPF